MVHKRKRKRYSPSPQSSELMWEDANGLEIEETVRRIQREKQIKPIWETPSMNLAEFQDTNQDLQWENANGKKLGRRKKSRRKKRSTNPQSTTPTSHNNNTNLDRVRVHCRSEECTVVLIHNPRWSCMHMNFIEINN